MEPTPTVRKRPKQACKNCRRKKARCPGERPSCSFCTRLKQHCEYDEPAAPRKIAKSTGQTKTARLAERVADLESKLQSLSSLKEDNSDVPPEYCPTGFLQSPTFETDTRSRSPPQDSLTSTEKSFDGDDDTPKFQRIPPTHVVVAATDAYFLVCHSRPCTFFFRDKFQRELENGLLPSYLLRAIVASTTHLLLDPWFDNKQLEATQTMAQLAWIEALNEAMSGISLNTVAILQTMGLLILLDLRTSSYSSAVTKLRMAVSVAESSGMNKEPDDQLSILQQEERRYVFWSLYVIDKVSALVLGNAPLLADHSCFLRLPEEQKLFRKSQQNNMTNLSAAKDSYSTRGGFSKLIVACSLVGQLAALSQDDTLYRGRFGGSLLELHKTLAAQIRRLGSMLSEEEGSTSATSGVEGRVQMMYARSMFHCIGIFINHPFFVKRYIPTNQRSPQVCIRTNQQCREHAERLGDWLRSAKSYDAVPHNQLFPGYAIFNACLVFCLFMNSPDRVVAAKSREQYEKLKILLYQQAVSGNSTDPDYYIRTLDHFASRPGAAGLLADASNTYIPTSRSPGLWHFLDFSWLDDHFSFGPKQDSQRKNSKENKEDDCLAMSYAMSSSADTQFPYFNTSPSDNPNSNIDQRMAPVQHASQRSSLEKSLPTWTNPKVSASEMQHYGFTTMQGNEFQDNTGMPTPSQSPPFINVNNYQQIYGSMDGNTESFGNWVASAYSRWDDDTMQDLGNQGNSAGEIRLLYG